MRLLIDLQGAQTGGSRRRGIGRYSMALTQELASVAMADGHSVHVLLNAAFPEALIEIRAVLRGLLPPDAVHVWQPPVGASEAVADRTYVQAAAMLREGVIASLAPDAVLVASLFEGLGDEAVSTLNGRLDASVTAVVLYDLIPYIQPENYLSGRTRLGSTMAASTSSAGPISVWRSRSRRGRRGWTTWRCRRTTLWRSPRRRTRRSGQHRPPRRSCGSCRRATAWDAGS